MLQIKNKLLNKDFFISVLVRYILPNAFCIRIFAHCVRIESTRPQTSSPQKMLYLWMFLKNLFCCYAFYDLYDLGHRQRRNTLNQKMDMVLFHPYLHKMDFVTSRYTKTDFLQCQRNIFCEYLSTIFRWKYHMIQQQYFVMVLVDMLIHACNLACHALLLKPPQRAGLTHKE